MSRPQPKVKATALPQAERLLEWYDLHRRILPWRALPGVTANPYHVWLSEIMLQQTTVAAVAPYYQKFLKRWPTVLQLAKAPLDEILQMWAGLGYYRRAHLLHDCAKVIAADYGGAFPETEGELLQLPGFGPYTAAAVAAIAFDQRANVVDGNVERVIARVFNIQAPLPRAKAEMRAAASTLLPLTRHGDYAQGLMDLGATVCTPRNPKCDLCPWNRACRAHARGIEDQLPRKRKATPKPVRYAMAFVIFNKKGEILIRRRPKKGLLGGMMEVPSSAWIEGKIPDLATVKKQSPIATRWTLLPGMVTHVFSHFELNVVVAMGAVAKPVTGKKYTWVAIERAEQEALPSVMLKIVRHVVKHI